MLRAGPRRCSLRGSHGGAKGGPGGGRRAGDSGAERGEEAAASLGVAEESLGFRTGWLFGCRLQEGKSNPPPNFARLGRFEAQIPPPWQPRLPAALLFHRSLARSLPGPVWAVRRAPAPAPARSQSVFHANPCAAPFPSAVAAPLPPGLPASSPAPRHLLPRAPCPPPASGRALGLPRPARSTPTWATGTAAAGLERAGPRAAPTGVPRAPGGSRGKGEARGSSVGVAGRTGLGLRRLAVRPWEDPGPRGSARKAEAQEVGTRTWTRARADPGPGPRRAPAARELFFFSLLAEITPAESPETVCEGGGWEGGEVGSQKWVFGNLSDSPQG